VSVPRKPTGVPTGEQFANKTQPESGSSPTDDPAGEQATQQPSTDPAGEVAADLLFSKWATKHIQNSLAGRIGIDVEGVRQAAWEPLAAAIASLPPDSRDDPTEQRRRLPRVVRTVIREATEANTPAPTNDTRRASSMSLVLATLPPDADDETIISTWHSRHPTDKSSDRLLLAAIRTARDGHPTTTSLNSLPDDLAPGATEVGNDDVDTALTLRALRGKQGLLTAEELLFLEERLRLGGPSQAKMIKHMRDTHRWSDRRTRRVQASLWATLHDALGIIPVASDDDDET